MVSSGSLHLQAPSSMTTIPGSPVRFAVSADDDQGLPVSAVVASKPNGAAFDPASGLFEWVPTDQEPGATEVSFTAANSLGFTQTKTVNINVGSIAADPDGTAQRGWLRRCGGLYPGTLADSSWVVLGRTGF